MISFTLFLYYDLSLTVTLATNYKIAKINQPLMIACYMLAIVRHCGDSKELGDIALDLKEFINWLPKQNIAKNINKI